MTVSITRSVVPRVKSPFGSRLGLVIVPSTMKSAALISPVSVCPPAEQNGQAAAGATPARTAATAARVRRMAGLRTGKRRPPTAARTGHYPGPAAPGNPPPADSASRPSTRANAAAVSAVTAGRSASSNAAAL